MKMFYDKKADEILITFVAKDDAKKALQQMKDWVAEYGDISVGDVNDLTGCTSLYDYRALTYGWRYSDLPEEVETVRTNISCFPVYAILLPEPRNLREEKPRKWQKNARPKDGYLNDLYAKEAFEHIDKTPIKKAQKVVNDAPRAKGEKRGYEFKEKSDDYKAGYKAGAREAIYQCSVKFELAIAEMKKELEAEA